MENKKFRPALDKLFWIILIPTAALMLCVTVLPSVFLFHPLMLLFSILTDLFVGYFFLSPLFGYVELCETSVFIKYGFFMKKEIPYEKIRGTETVRRFYADSMVALKNGMEHVNIKYNAFDVITVSVTDCDALIEAIEERMKK